MVDKVSQSKLIEGVGIEDIADVMARSQKSISVAEFFEKNRHLLGFDNASKALLTTIKEAVDNSLDACEEASILPNIYIEIIEMSNSRYKIIIEDNGPGIVEAQLSSIFGKLLYGSKFHRLKQSRGQQGIGISAAILYGQLTTGKDAKIVSKIKSKEKAIELNLRIDTKTNMPVTANKKEISWYLEHGTRIEIDLEGDYRQGSRSVDEYLRQIAIVNPHATITYVNPKAEQMIYTRVVKEIPEAPKEIKPHPDGIEFGRLLSMLRSTSSKALQSFLIDEFSRVGVNTAKEIILKSGLSSNFKPQNLKHSEVDRLYHAMKEVKVPTPPTDCLSPIGEDKVEKGLQKEINAEFFCTNSRPASVYRGNPFIIEVGLAYGGDLPSDSQVKIMRFANRVPLLYQQGACAFNEAVKTTNWKSYNVSQTNNALPICPMVLLIHIASVWTPYTSEAKEAIAHYDEIIKELKLALQEVGRKLKKYLAKKVVIAHDLKKKKYIETFIPHISAALKDILDLSADKEFIIEQNLKEVLENDRGFRED